MSDPHIDAESSEGASGTPFDNYVEGAKDKFGNVIKDVFGRHRAFVVYSTKDGYVRWIYDPLPEPLRPAIVEFNQLKQISSKLGKKRRAQVAPSLGYALAAALLSSDTGESLKGHFGVARDSVIAKAIGASKLSYILLSTLFGLGIAGICQWALSRSGLPFCAWGALSAGISGGAAGAIISIIQRGRNLKIDPMESAFLLAMNGLSRVVLGIIFGLLLVCAIEADIVLGHFSQNLWALFGCAAGAGFTEHWVPGLLG